MSLVSVRPVVLVLLLLCGFSPARAQDVADLLDAVRPSVVTIEATNGEGSALGTGFVVRKDGLVVTAAHVIKDARAIRAKFISGKTARVTRVLEEDTDQDFAVLRIEGDNYPALTMGDSEKLRQGQRVVSLGNPLGLDFTASEGIVSALRDANGHAVATGGDIAYVQTTAAISQGNSGGPIFNAKGEVVGLAVFKIKGGENLNFALAINRVKPLIDGTRIGADTTPTKPEAIGKTGPSAKPSTTKVPPASATPREQWLLVASRAANRDQVYKFLSGGSPLGTKENEDWIKQKWDAGYHITDLANGDNRWAVIMTKDAGFTNQSVLADPNDFPTKRVRELWDDDYFITTALYGSNRWVVIMSQYPKDAAQRMDQVFKLGTEFPKDWVKEKFEAGYRITVANSDGKQWLVVMTKGTNLEDQTYKVFDDLPREWVRDYWDKGYYITSIGSRAASFVVVMSKGVKYTQQDYKFTGEFPKNWIKEKWDGGWDITSIR